MILLKIKIIVESALIVGDNPPLIIAKIYKDKVCDSGPAQKNEIKKSSSDKIKINKAAENKAGYKIGKITLKNVCRIDAPKSNDASINNLFTSANELYINGKANPRPNKVWPTIKVVKPNGILKWVNIVSKATAIAISGIKTIKEK